MGKQRNIRVDLNLNIRGLKKSATLAINSGGTDRSIILRGFRWGCRPGYCRW